MSTLKNQLIKELAEHEHIVHIFSWEELIKELENKNGVIMTTASYASPLRDSLTAIRLLRELGLTGKVVIKNYGGKTYVILKGYAGDRKLFQGTRYLYTNPKVIRLAVGPKGIRASVKGGFVLSVVLCTGINVFDYFIRDTATLFDLMGNVTSDIIKIGISSIAAAAAGLAVGSVAVIGSIGAVPLIAAIAIGVASGYALNKIDEKIGATKALIDTYEKIGISLEKTVHEIADIPHKINREVYHCERWLVYRAISGALQY